MKYFIRFIKSNYILICSIISLIIGLLLFYKISPKIGMIQVGILLMSIVLQIPLFRVIIEKLNFTCYGLLVLSSIISVRLLANNIANYIIMSLALYCSLVICPLFITFGIIKLYEHVINSNNKYYFNDDNSRREPYSASIEYLSRNYKSKLDSVFITDNERKWLNKFRKNFFDRTQPKRILLFSEVDKAKEVKLDKLIKLRELLSYENNKKGVISFLFELKSYLNGLISYVLSYIVTPIVSYVLNYIVKILKHISFKAENVLATYVIYFLICILIVFIKRYILSKLESDLINFLIGIINSAIEIKNKDNYEGNK